MTESPPNVPQLWHFTYPLAYLLVDGKQVVNNDIDLVLRREAVIAAHPAYRHRHTLRIYTNGINPKVELLLDQFIPSRAARADQGSIRYSAQRRRLTIKDPSKSTSGPTRDLRFKTRHDLLEAVARLREIGVVCADDDGGLGAVPRPQSGIGSRSVTASPAFLTGNPRPLSSNGSRSQTACPAFLLSAEMVKAGRVMSPLERKPDGSTPSFCLVRLSKDGRSDPTPTSQASFSAQQPQESQSTLSPGQKLNVVSKPNTRRFAPELLSHGSSSSKSSQESRLVLPPRRELNSTSNPGPCPVESTADSARPRPSRQGPTLSQPAQDSQLVLPPRCVLDTTTSNPALGPDLVSGYWPMRGLSPETYSMLPPRRELNFVSKRATVPWKPPTDGPTAQLPRQESFGSQLLPKSEVKLPKGGPDFIPKPTSIAAMARRGDSASQLESIPPVLSRCTPVPLGFVSSSTVKSDSEPLPQGIDMADGASSSGGLHRVPSVANADTPSIQPAKRQKLSQQLRQKHSIQRETASLRPSFQISLTQSQDRASVSGKLERSDSTKDRRILSSQSSKRPGVFSPPEPWRYYQEETASPSSRTLSPQAAVAETGTAKISLDESSQHLQMLHASERRPSYRDAEVQTDGQGGLDAATAETIHKINLHQLMVWEGLRESLHRRVETDGDDDQDWEELVNNYVMELNEEVSKTIKSYL